MAKIALLLPKEFMKEQAEKVIKRNNFNIHSVKVIQSVDAISEARDAVNKGADIIVSRGYQAKLIQENTNIPVAEMKVSVQDLGLLINKAKALSNKEEPKIAVVSFKNMVEDISYFSELFNIRLYEHYMNDFEDIEDIIKELIAEKIDVVLGGETIVEVVSRYGMHSLFLSSTENSIENALILASKIGDAIDIEQGNKAYIDTVMETSFNGIIKIDTDCKITAINHYVEEILNIKYTNVTGTAVDKVIKEINIDCVRDILRGTRESYSTSIRMNGISAMLIMAPIQADENIYGAIISVRRLELSMNSSENIKDMLMNGFTARYNFSSIVTSSPEYIENLELAKKYALTKAAVLITGGDMLAGERIAQSIHNNSNRRTAPYISVSLDGLNDEEQLITLFGNRDSSDTDNSVKQRGVIESCNIGTVYISDIDKMSPGCQNRLLKIVNYLPVYIPDADERKRFDVKIIASSKTELLPLVEAGKFREELYYCLCPFVVNIPPLRRRPEDIRTIVENRLQDFKDKFSAYITVSDKAMDVITSYNWEGNELQLNFFCDRLFVTTTKRVIDEDYTRRLLDELYPHKADIEGEERLVVYKHPEAEELTQLLEEHRGNRTEVAKALGISTTTLWRKMKKYGLLTKYKN